MKLTNVMVTRKSEGYLTESVNVIVEYDEAKDYLTPENLAKNYIEAAVKAGQKIEWGRRDWEEKGYGVSYSAEEMKLEPIRNVKSDGFALNEEEGNIFS